jgi:hypothetical protein
MQGDVTKIQGHRHLLSFADGPKMCLGKPFALAAFKVRNFVIGGGLETRWILIWPRATQATLSVLVRNYAFELRDGPDTKLEIGRVLGLRPKVAGEEECCMPLRVRRVD